MPEEKRITFRVPLAEYEHYVACAEKEGHSLPVWIRRTLMLSSRYKNAEINGVPVQRLPKNNPTKYDRYNLKKARRYVERQREKGNTDPDLDTIERAVEKIAAPGRNVLTAPQRRVMKRWRLANWK